MATPSQSRGGYGIRATNAPASGGSGGLHEASGNIRGIFHQKGVGKALNGVRKELAALALAKTTKQDGSRKACAVKGCTNAHLKGDKRCGKHWALETKVKNNEKVG